MMRLPLRMSAVINDVRGSNSTTLPWYFVLAVKGMPHDATLAPFSQIRVVSVPQPWRLGNYGTYRVPANQLTAFWREGRFLQSGPVLWSYFHAHPSNLEGLLMYVGATAEQVHLAASCMPCWSSASAASRQASAADSLPCESCTMQLGLRNSSVGEDLREVGPEQFEAVLDSVAARAAQSGAELMCRYQRDTSMLEVVPVRAAAHRSQPRCWLSSNCVRPPTYSAVALPLRRLVTRAQGTAEIDEQYWRKSAACVPFALDVGLPFVTIVLHTPDSLAAAQAHADPDHPDEFVAEEHAFVRIFMGLPYDADDYRATTCGPGCGYDIVGGLESPYV